MCFVPADYRGRRTYRLTIAVIHPAPIVRLAMTIPCHTPHTRPFRGTPKPRRAMENREFF